MDCEEGGMVIEEEAEAMRRHARRVEEAKRIWVRP